MIQFFRTQNKSIIAVQVKNSLSPENIEKLNWLFSDSVYISEDSLEGWYIGPRKEMITPWSTNAVEITQNMGINGILRMEEFFRVENEKAHYDPMLQRLYQNLSQNIFTINKQPEPILSITDISAYNEQEGLALSVDEVQYLNRVSKEMGRPLTDGEVYGFAQVNSEHCRHKIFNGTFIIDGKEMESSLFQMIKKTSNTNPNKIISFRFLNAWRNHWIKRKFGLADFGAF